MGTVIGQQKINGNNHNGKRKLGKQITRAFGVQQKRVRCHPKRTGAVKPHRGRRRKLPYEGIQRLHAQGLTGVAIAEQLKLTTDSVEGALRAMGLGTGQHRCKRMVLPGGKIRCSACKKSKKAIKFRRRGSRCRPCDYKHWAVQSNQCLERAIHVRDTWFRNRAKRLGIHYDLTDEQLTELYVTQNGRCAYCHKPMVMELGIRRSDDSESIERIIPQKLGGTHTIKNVLWVHFGCNRRRMEMTGERLKVGFPEAGKAIEKAAVERHLKLPFPLDSEINLTNDQQPQTAAV